MKTLRIMPVAAVAAFFVSGICHVQAINVVQLGDSIGIGVRPFLELALPEDTISFPELSSLPNPVNNEGTRQWLAIDSGLNEPRFVRRLNTEPERDLIVANAGIHNMRAETNLSNDPHKTFGTTPETYQDHLNDIFDRLATYDVPIVWVTTTPIPSDHPNIAESRQAEFRAKELAVVNQRADVVVDAYNLLVDRFEEEPWRAGPADLHLNDAGSQLVAQAVANAVNTVKATQVASVPEPSALVAGFCIWSYYVCRRVPRGQRSA